MKNTYLIDSTRLKILSISRPCIRFEIDPAHLSLWNVIFDMQLYRKAIRMCTRQRIIFRRSSSFNLSSQWRIYSFENGKNRKRKAYTMMLSSSLTDMRFFHIFIWSDLTFLLSCVRRFSSFEFHTNFNGKKLKASLLTPFWRHTRIIPISIYHFAFSQFDTSIQYCENIHRRWRERKRKI